MMGERLIPTRYRLMRPDGSHDTGEVMWPREPGYIKISSLVEPLLAANLEHVSVLADFDGGRNFNQADMFVDETGVLNELPRNEEATTIYRRAALCGRAACPIPRDPEELPFIAGPAVLFSRRIWF